MTDTEKSAMLYWSDIGLIEWEGTGSMLYAEEIKQYYKHWRETMTLYEEWAKAHQITYNELLIFLSLWEYQDGCTQKAICSQWLLSKQTVNSIFQNLTKQGFVELRTMEKDRRNKAAFLTEAGACHVREIVERLQKQEEYVMGKLGEARRTVLLESMELYNHYFQEDQGYE